MADARSNDVLLTAKELAEILRVRPSTIFSAAAAGRIPCIRIWTGQRRALIRFRRSDVDKLLAVPAPRPETGPRLNVKAKGTAR